MRANKSFEGADKGDRNGDARLEAQREKLQRGKGQEKGIEVTDTPELAEARGKIKIESFTDLLEKVQTNLQNMDKTSVISEQSTYVDRAKELIGEAHKIIETASQEEISDETKEPLYITLSELATQIGGKLEELKLSKKSNSKEHTLSINNLISEYRETANRAEETRHEIGLLKKNRGGNQTDNTRIEALEEDLKNEEYRLEKNKLGKLFYDIEESLKKQITSTANIPLAVKLEYIGYIKEDIESIKNIAKDLSPKDAMVINERLKHIEEDVSHEEEMRLKEKDARNKTRKQKNSETKIPEKVEQKQTIESKTEEIRSNELALLFAEVNAKIFDDSVELRDLFNLQKKLADALRSAEANKVIDNFSNNPVHDEEKERLIQKINGSIEKISTKAFEIFQSDLEFVREQYNAIKNEENINISARVIERKINSIQRYLNETTSNNPELREELKEIVSAVQKGPKKELREKITRAKNIAQEIHHIMDFSVMTDEKILEKIGQSNKDTPENIENELDRVSNLIEVVKNSKSDFEISFGNKDLDNELPVDQRRAETIDFLEGFKSRLHTLYDVHISKKETQNLFSAAITLIDVENVLQSIDTKRVGGFTKDEIISSLHTLESIDAPEYLKLAKQNHNFNSDYRIQSVPTAYGMREAVVKILNQKLEPFAETVQKEKKEEQKRNRGILTKGNLTQLEFTSIDNALSEPGFADFLVLQDKYFGGNSSEKAVAEDNTEYIKAQYEIYVSAREVSRVLKGVLDTEVERDFGGRIAIPREAFANIDDYILDIAVKAPDYLKEIQEVVTHSIEIPKKVATLEKDLAAAYSIFNNIEGLERAEKEVVDKEKLLAEIKASAGQDKEELIAQFKRNKALDISVMERLPFPFRSRKNILSKGLRYAEIAYREASISLDKLNHYAHNLENAKDQDALLDTITAINQSYEPVDGRILDRDNIDALMQASTHGERQMVVQEIKNKFIIQKAEYSNLARKTREVISSEELGFFKKPNLVDALIEEGLIDSEIGTIGKTLLASSSIRSAAKKLETQIIEDKEKIRSVKERLSSIEEQKDELKRLYAYSTRRLFKGISAVDQTRLNIEDYVRGELFKDSEDIDIDEEVAKKVNELKKGKKESYEDFLVRKEQYEKGVREEIRTKYIEKAEKDLGSLQALKERNQGKKMIQGSVENIDQSNQMTYMRTSDIEKAEVKISARIREGLRQRIEDMLSELDQKEGVTLTDIQNQIILWTHRPPTIKWAGEKKFQNMVVTHTHKDAVKGKESEKIILEILKEKKGKMNAVSDAPKRILLTRIISKLENKQHD